MSRSLWGLWKRQGVSFHRHGLFLVTVFVTLIYVLILWFIPLEARLTVASFLILGDPPLLGFLYLGAVSLLERQQGIFLALRILPWGWEKILLVRVGWFCLAATASGLGILAFTGLLAGEPLAWTAYAGGALALTLGSAQFTLWGLALALSIKGFNHFLLLGGVLIVPLGLGLVSLVAPEIPELMFLPSWGVAQIWQSGLGQNFQNFFPGLLNALGWGLLALFTSNYAQSRQGRGS